MTIQTAEGHFLINAGAGSVATVAGLSFAPECVLFWTAGIAQDTELVPTAGHAGMSFGAALGPASRRASGASFPNATGYNTGSRIVCDDCCVTIPAVGIPGRGTVDLTSLNADGFSVVVDIALPNNCCVHYLAIRGYTNYAMGDIVMPAGVGNQSVAGLGFKPCGEIFSGAGVANYNANLYAIAELGIGAAVDATHQFTLAIFAQGQWDSEYYFYNGECFSETDGATAVSTRCALVSQDAGGFTYNVLETNVGEKHWYLAFGGGSMYVGNTQTRTDGLDISLATSFPPSGFLFFSNMATMCAQDTGANADSDLVIGGASDIGRRSVVGFRWQSGKAAPSNVVCAQYLNEVYESHTTGAVLEGLMDVKSFDALGGTAVMDDPDPAARVFGYIAFGPSVVENRKRVITYTRDTFDPDPRLRDASGTLLDPWECHADAWVKFLGVFSATPNVPVSLVDDAEAGYIEEIGWDSTSDAPKIYTSRMDLGETIIAQAAAKSGS